MIRPTFFFACAVFLLVGESAFCQMEKREDELYRLKQFVKAWPTIGDTAPDLEIRSLDGKKICLSDYRGKTVVLIKGGYT